MVPDKDTNFVYLSGKLLTDPRFPGACDQITSVLLRNEVPFAFLEETKDVWARDYMPLQTEENAFRGFRYEPSYLADAPELRSDAAIVCTANNIRAGFLKINLDGGNVVKWYDKAIVSRRIIKENEPSDESALLEELEKGLNTKVILIPDLNPEIDFAGHADGYARFYNGNTVLVNNLKNEYKYWSDGFKKSMKNAGLDYIEVPWFEYKEKDYPNSAIGLYINFLEMENVIILPVFEIKGNKDDEVVDLFTSLYPQKKIEVININSVARHGGLLNCITWNIKI